MSKVTNKLKVSEIFGPAGYWNFNVIDGGYDTEFVERWGVTQGEGQYVGKRSVFLRLFGCNLRCPAFGLDHDQKTTEPADFAKNIKLYKNISETPAAKYGCDSYFSVYPEFKSLSPTKTVDEIADMILASAGGTLFPEGKTPIHLVITGGEPLLPGWQTAFDLLISTLTAKMKVCKPIHLTFETNGTQTLNEDVFANLCLDTHLTFSVSPKLKASGHTPEEAINESLIADYADYTDSIYLKFVVQDVCDFDEIDAIVEKVQFFMEDTIQVYIMPEGGTVDEFQKHNTMEIVSEAVKRGYDITTRLQVMVGANVTGW